MIIRIATRRSPLALWQANSVYEAIRAVDKSIKVFLVPVQTKYEKDLTIPISAFAAKGAFSKEVQNLVLAGRADIAVHSAKDLQINAPEGLTIAAFPRRGDPHDVLVGKKLDELSRGATVATGSSRRKVLLLEKRPDLNVVELRGNIEKRLEKLKQVDAIVMAACALRRLNKKVDVVDALHPDYFIPQVGQGALAVEARVDDFQILEILKGIDHGPTRSAVEAERSFLEQLGGDCDTPAGSYASQYGNSLKIRGFLAGESVGDISRGQEIGLPKLLPGKRLALKLQQSQG